MRVFTVGHGTRSGEELVEVLVEGGVRTLVDVRRFAGSRRHPQFNGPALAASVGAAGIGYMHAVELGGRRSGEAGEELFGCIRVAAFRSYAARMRTAEWQEALAAAIAEPTPCFLCAETLWWRCHRRLVAELLYVRGYEVIHLLRPGHSEPHRPWEPIAESRDGVLYLCGEPVA
jgi:uncharacterized protein (DUF488 family)